jgi:cytochrome c biogenesis protein CcmG/thiol:disulfide interchange protein DsbE
MMTVSCIGEVGIGEVEADIIGSMRSKSRFWMRFMLAIAMGCTLSGLTSCDRGKQPTLVGKVAPNFIIQDGTRTVSLQQFRGKPLIVNFWASWCAPCVQEIPSLEALHHQLPDLKILAVSTDSDPDAYARFLAEHPMDLDMVRDPSQDSNRAFGSYRFPETFIIDSRGVVLRRFIGFQDWTSPDMLQYLRQVP